MPPLAWPCISRQMTARRKYFHPTKGREVRSVPLTLWSDEQVERLIDDLTDAPLIGIGWIDRYVKAETYRVPRRRDGWNWDNKDLLTQKMQAVLEGITEGKTLSELEHEGVSYDPRQQMQLVRARLGAVTTAHAVALAVGHGLVEVPEPRFPPGRKFELTRPMKNYMKDISSARKHVLRLVCNGFTNEEIGNQLGVSLETIKSQVVDLRRYYGARSRTHLAAIAIRMGHVR